MSLAMIKRYCSFAIVSTFHADPHLKLSNCSDHHYRFIGLGGCIRQPATAARVDARSALVSEGAPRTESRLPVLHWETAAGCRGASCSPARC